MNVILFKSEMVGEPWCSIKPGITHIYIYILKIILKQILTSFFCLISKNILINKRVSIDLFHSEHHKKSVTAFFPD